MTDGEELSPSDFESGCPWCDDYDGEHVAPHASQAHPDEWDGVDYEKSFTTIRVPTQARDAAETHKHADETWGGFIQRCGEHPRPVQELVDADALDAAGVDYDDVVQACRQAVRDELGEVVER